MRRARCAANEKGDSMKNSGLWLIWTGAFLVAATEACNKDEPEQKKTPAPVSAPAKPAKEIAKKETPPPPPPKPQVATVKLVGEKVNGTATIQKEKLVVELKGADPGD